MKPRKLPKLKLPFLSRLRGVVLLRQGKSIEQAVRALAKRHPGVSLETVKRAYFPKSGPFAVNYLEGLSRAEITRLYDERTRKSWTKFRERASERLKRLHTDPVFAAAHRERGRAAMSSLHDDPVFAAGHRERARDKMMRLNADPEFAARRNARLNVGLVFEAKRLAGKKRFHALVKETRSIAKGLIAELPAEQRQVADLFLFGSPSGGRLTVRQIAQQLQRPQKQTRALLTKALEKLSEIKKQRGPGK